MGPGCALILGGGTQSGEGGLGLGQYFAANLLLRPPKQRTEFDDIIESSTQENRLHTWWVAELVDTEECGAEVMRVDDDAEIVLDGIFLSLCLIQAGGSGPGGRGMNGILECLSRLSKCP